MAFLLQPLQILFQSLCIRMMQGMNGVLNQTVLAQLLGRSADQLVNGAE